MEDSLPSSVALHGAGARPLSAALPCPATRPRAVRRHSRPRPARGRTRPAFVGCVGAEPEDVGGQVGRELGPIQNTPTVATLPPTNPHRLPATAPRPHTPTPTSHRTATCRTRAA